MVCFYYRHLITKQIVSIKQQYVTNYKNKAANACIL